MTSDGYVSLETIQDGDCTVYLLQLLVPSFNPLLVSAIHSALDRISHAIADSDSCVVVTTGIGKYYNLGFDLDYLAKHQEVSASFINRDYAGLLRRFIGLPCPTAALLNGHTYAAGMAFSCVHDYRYVLLPSDSNNSALADGSSSKKRAKGWACMNEIDLPAVIPNPMHCAITAVIGKGGKPERDLLLYGKRIDLHNVAEAALFVDRHQTFEEFLKTASSFGYRAKNGRVLALLRKKRYAETLKAIDEDADRTENPFRFFSPASKL